MSRSKFESARINGAKSRGPKTTEGKAKSSQNADLFEELTQDFIRRFEPRDGVELAIVETMNLEMARDQDPDLENLRARSFHAAIGNSPSIQLFHRYENPATSASSQRRVTPTFASSHIISRIKRSIPSIR